MESLFVLKTAPALAPEMEDASCRFSRIVLMGDGWACRTNAAAEVYIFGV